MLRSRFVLPKESRQGTRQRHQQIHGSVRTRACTVQTSRAMRSHRRRIAPRQTAPPPAGGLAGAPWLMGRQRRRRRPGRGGLGCCPLTAAVPAAAPLSGTLAESGRAPPIPPERGGAGNAVQRNRRTSPRGGVQVAGGEPSGARPAKLSSGQSRGRGNSAEHGRRLRASSQRGPKRVARGRRHPPQPASHRRYRAYSSSAAASARRRCMRCSAPGRARGAPAAPRTAPRPQRAAETRL